MSSVTQSIGSDGVHLGYWINWSHGSVQGATITLSRENGGLLTAFVALFVTVVGTSFWRITCFALHHILSSEGPQDGLYHQRQAILRNAGTSTIGLVGLIKLGLAWCKVARRPYQRILPFIALASISLASFAVAGIFSSRISTLTGDEVLVSSQGCGTIDLALDLNTTDLETVYAQWSTKYAVSQADYAQLCYTDTATETDCPSYVKKNLPVTTNRTADCPFDDSICLSSNTNLRLDTGYINSHTDLGMNAPSKDRILYRSVTQCAPITTEGYTKLYNDTDDTLPYQFMGYYYGAHEDTVVNETGVTYQYPIDQPGRVWMNATSAFDTDYTLYAHYAYMYNGSYQPSYSTFSPIEELSRDDADVALFFLSANSISFKTETDDSWYSAHQAVGRAKGAMSVDDGESEQGDLGIYAADEPVTVLGCTLQKQYCNPNLPESSRCGPLTANMMAMEQAQQLWTTEEEKTRLEYADGFMAEGDNIALLVGSLGVSSLTSRYSLDNGFQGPLPSNQWQLEVEHWHSTQLADLQRSPVLIATGPSDPSVDRWIKAPETADEKSFLCQNQKIRSTNYANFSLLALIITFVIGGVIIVVSHTLERAVSLIQKRWKRDVYGRSEWSTTGTLQLQRLAHEELGIGTWTRTTKEIPVTSNGEFLGVLDLSDPEHPRLMASERRREGSSAGESSDDNAEKKDAVLQREREVSPVSKVGDEVDSLGHDLEIREVREQRSSSRPRSAQQGVLSCDEASHADREASRADPDSMIDKGAGEARAHG